MQKAKRYGQDTKTRKKKRCVVCCSSRVIYELQQHDWDDSTQFIYLFCLWCDMTLCMPLFLNLCGVYIKNVASSARCDSSLKILID